MARAWGAVSKLLGRNWLSRRHNVGTVRKCQALFVTQRFHFPHKWPPEKAGAGDVSPVWPLPWTPTSINAAQARRGDSTKSWRRSAVSGHLYLGRWQTFISGTHDRETANVRHKTELCPASWGGNKTGGFCSSPASTQGLVLRGSLALTCPWTTGQVTHVWISERSDHSHCVEKYFL